MDFDEYLKYEAMLKKEVVPGILQYLQDKEIPASLAPKLPELLERAIAICNQDLLADSSFKAYPCYSSIACI